MDIKLGAVLMTGLLGAATCAFAQSTSQSPQTNTSSAAAAQSAAGDQSTTETRDSSSTGHIDSSANANESQMSTSQREFMRKCMEHAKQANDGMSEKDMKKTCHHQMKQHAAGDQDKPVTPQY
jgi:hypothetical protein